MIFPNTIIAQLAQNKAVFGALLKNIPKDIQFFRPNLKSWCILEIVAHLLDEEIYDFRARVKHVLTTPEEPLKSISPKTWPMEHKYLDKDYHIVLEQFLNERTTSVSWLKSLAQVSWDNSIFHPELGQMTAKVFLENWLAHDYLHIRQINQLKRAFLNDATDDELLYAGNW